MSLYMGRGYIWVVAIYGSWLYIQPQPMYQQDKGKQVDQDPGDLISFGNEPQDGFPVKPAR